MNDIHDPAEVHGEANGTVRGDDALALLGLSVDAQTVAAAIGTASETNAADIEDTSSRRDPQAVGRRVAQARAKSQLTGSQLGERVKLQRDQISKIEHGQRRLGARELPAFAAALGVTIRYLLGSEESPRMALAHRLSQSTDPVDPGAAPADVPATQRRALDLLKVEELLAGQVDLPQPRLSAPGAQVRAFTATEMQRRPRNKAEAQRQGRRLAEEVRAALDLGSAEIRDLAAVIETHFAADVALSPLGTEADGLCAHTDDKALLVASSSFSDGHVRFTLAHELGHHLLGDPREVIAEGAGEMYADDVLERRVNSFAAHLLLPEDGVREAMAWVGVDGSELREATPGARQALGELMQRFGVSLQALLFQLADLRVIGFDDAMKLKTALRARAMTDEASAGVEISGLSGLSGPLTSVEGSVRPPQRLLSSALDAARAGVIGTGTIAVLLERDDDDELFAAVMGDDLDEASAPLLFADEE